jgi:DNA-binding NtrC family response regulator
LRVLEDRHVRRLGSTTDVQVDIRILAASSRDLLKAVEEGTFRQDLYYRINVVVINMPLLNERADDIPLFLAYFIQKFNKEMGRHVEGVTDEALALLTSYTWPGNVRELRNVVERATVLCDGPLIGVELMPVEISHLARPPRSLPPDPLAESLNLKEHVARLETELIQRALQESGGIQTEAARMLGLSRDELRHRMKRYGLDSP